MNGTVTLKPAALAAFSTPMFPASTITSAIDAPCDLAIGSSTERTFAKRAGSLPSQFFCGAKRIRAPFAPPR